MATTFSWTKTASGTASDWNTTSAWKSSGTAGVPGNTSTDVAVLPSALGALYAVTIGSADPTFNLASLSVSGSSGTGHGTDLNINGMLNTGTLVFGGSASQSFIDIGVGGSFEVGTTITSTIAETVTITATGAGGYGTGGWMEFGSATSSGFVAGLANTNITYSFANNASGINSGVIDFKDYTLGSTVTAAQKITNLKWGDEFVVNGVNFTGATIGIASGTLTATAGTSIIKFTGLTLGSLTAANFVGNGNAIQIVCYVRGTRIATVRGEVAIEDLTAGDLIVTASGEIQPVKWIGSRRLDLTAHPRPETVAPIRILRGAFADQMPHRDLLVSPDHAIFVDGKLICARQLINGTTILQETGWTAVDYYHVELDEHAVLFAEGLPAESYINTGNSGFFSNSGAPLTLHPDLTDESDYPTREAGSCAPLVWDEAGVRPVWQRLADRAVALGKPMPQHATTTDTGLHLVAKGKTVRPMYCDSDLAIFALPRHASEVRLVSRAQSPTDARPWLEDRRRLGVRVARIVLRGADDLREIPVDHPSLAKGWWAIERDGVAMLRWTDGDAVVPLPVMEGDVLLELHLGGTMTYVVEAETSPQRRVA
jgi:hypothetical protein